MGGILLKWVKFNEFHHSGSKSTRTASEPCKKAYELLLFSASGAEGCFLMKFTWISHFSIKVMISTSFHEISWKWWNSWFLWPKVVPFAAGAVGLTIYKRMPFWEKSWNSSLKLRNPHLLWIYCDFMEISGFHGKSWKWWEFTETSSPDHVK